MIEKLILSNLLNNEEYGRKAIPFLKTEYFQDRTHKAVFDCIKAFTDKYNKFPSKEALLLELDNEKSVASYYDETVSFVTQLEDTPSQNTQWLLDHTESFCQDKAIYNAIMKSISILDSGKGNESKGSIPQILSDALAISFDSHIGHDFLEDYDARYDFYHKKEKRVPFDLDLLNKISKGGLPNKTLNVVLAGCVHPETKIRIRLKK